MPDTSRSTEEVRITSGNTSAEIEHGNLIKELEAVISNVRNSCFNEDASSHAMDEMFAFNIGLLCGLKQGRK